MRNKVLLGMLPLVMMAITGCSSSPEIKSPAITSYLQENGEKVHTTYHCTLGTDGKCLPEIDPESSKTEYEKERDRMMAKIVRGSPIPMRVPSTILKVLIMPYADDSGALTSQSYKFVKVDDGKWIMGEYLSQDGMTAKMLTPLVNVAAKDDDSATVQQDAQKKVAPQQQTNSFNPMMNKVSQQMQKTQSEE